MLKILRRNQKKIMAVVVIFSMITFVATLAPRVASTGLTAHDMGTINGVKFTNLDEKAALDDWKALNSLSYADPNLGQPYPLANVLFYGVGVGAINQKPETFFILLQEARSHGIAPSPEEVNDYLKNLVQQPGPDDMDRAVQAITDGLTVKHLVERDLDMVKITFPLRNYDLALENQEISLNVASFPAAKYLAQVRPPKPIDLQNQFDRLSSILPGNYGNNLEPLGFGYEIPDRVAFQYIGVKYSAVRAAVIASQSQLDWLTDAYKYFQKNRETIDEKPVSPPAATTRPDALTAAVAAAATQPATPGGATRPALTQPSTEPSVLTLTDVQLDFQLHAQIVLDQLYDDAAQAKISEIARDITDQLNVTFGKITNTSGASADDLKSKAFLDKLAAGIQDKYQVPIVYADISQPKSADDLKTFEPLKEAVWAKNMYSDVAFATYALNYAQPLMTADMKNSGDNLDALSAWQPSQILRTQDPDSEKKLDAYVFRLTSIEPAHAPASLADAHDQVLHDWKISQAYDLAKKDANSLHVDAEKRNLMLAAADMKEPIVTTLPFNVRQLAGDSQAKLAPLTFDHAGLAELANAGNSMLTTPSGSTHPISVADLYADATVCVIELNSAQPTWNRDDPGMAESTVIQAEQTQFYGYLLQRIYNYDDAVRRTQFQQTTAAAE